MTPPLPVVSSSEPSTSYLHQAAHGATKYADQTTRRQPASQPALPLSTSPTSTSPHRAASTERCKPLPSPAHQCPANSPPASQPALPLPTSPTSTSPHRAASTVWGSLWASSYIMPVATRTRRGRREPVRAEPESSENEPEQSLERVERFRSADAIDRFQFCTNQRALYMERGFIFKPNTTAEYPEFVHNVIAEHQWRNFCRP
ncbi:hypothetical protein TIFTF001_046654 [Ficus carica]|uniref:Uncharacterized protein n=1 Tax=Ficus carica TaxID=3494 RepID=A0AA87ZGW7_FICCA|nr:hypothetical protein TIFTF001_046654 [Ficus carica]